MGPYSTPTQGDASKPLLVPSTLPVSTTSPVDLLKDTSPSISEESDSDDDDNNSQDLAAKFDPSPRFGPTKTEHLSSHQLYAIFRHEFDEVKEKVKKQKLTLIYYGSDLMNLASDHKKFRIDRTMNRQKDNTTYNRLSSKIDVIGSTRKTKLDTTVKVLLASLTIFGN